MRERIGLTMMSALLVAGIAGGLVAGLTDRIGYDVREPTVNGCHSCW